MRKPPRGHDPGPAPRDCPLDSISTPWLTDDGSGVDSPAWGILNKEDAWHGPASTFWSRWRSRLRATILAAAGLLAVSGVGLAPTASAQSTVGTCSSGSAKSSYGAFFREKYGPGISAVAGRATVVNLTGCTSPGHTDFGVNFDVPWVLPANLQTDACYCIVQVGYGRCEANAACANLWPNDDKQHFAFTKYDNTGGVMYDAGWYPNDPVGGRTYGFKVESDTNSSGDPIWRYCIRDITMGDDYTCTTRARTWGSSTGNLGWWGAETNNTKSQLGHKPTSTSDINMRAQYRRGGDWFWVDKWGGADPCVVVQNSGTPPSRYKCTTKNKNDTNGDGSLNDLDTADPWTDDTL